MSRLADMLMGMDRRVLPPEGIGGIPQLTAPGEGASRRWRRAAVLVIVVGMLAFPAAAFMMRPRPVTLTATGASARTVAPLPTPGPAASDERFQALVGRALQAAQARALPEAAGLLEKALELKPTDAETWNSLGVVLVLQGDTARGADAFGQALRLDPTRPEAHRNLAVALEWALSRDRADHARLVREIVPSFDGATRLTAYLDQWLGGNGQSGRFAFEGLSSAGSPS